MFPAKKALPIMLSVMLMFACENQQQEKSAQKNQKSSSGDAVADTEELKGDSDKQSDIDLGKLFKDEIEIRTSDFDLFTACGDLFSSTAVMKKQMLPWPAKLKKLMLGELNKMPIRKKIKDSVIGYYLVKKGNLDNAAGVLCGTTDNGRGVIFFDEGSMKELGDYSKVSMSSSYTLSTMPVPFPVWTVVHETMHAIDNFFYTNRENGFFTEEREKVAELAWNHFTDSKYRDISILTLNGGAAPRVSRTCVLSNRPGKASGGFQLLGDSPEEDARDLKYMEEKTNFITPYSMKNAFEDFADTITAYYIGTRSGWSVWKTYSIDLTATPQDEDKVVYTLDSEDLIKSSKAHRKKMCALANLVFDEDCEAKLP